MGIKEKIAEDSMKLSIELIRAYYNARRYDNDNDDKEKVRKITQEALKCTKELYKEAGLLEEDKIHDGDIVILELDDGIKQYFITREYDYYLNHKSDITVNSITFLFESVFEILPLYSSIGKAIIGKYVGDEFIYTKKTDEDAKNLIEYKGKILHRIPTNKSNKELFRTEQIQYENRKAK